MIDDEDEWIGYDQIGLIFNGKVFTYEEYESVENKYLSVINTAFLSSGVPMLFINKLEMTCRDSTENDSEREVPMCPDDVVSLVERGWLKTSKEVEVISRAILRSYIWAELSSPHYILNITFGYDYYMYIESNDENVIHTITQNLPEGMYIG